MRGRTLGALLVAVGVVVLGAQTEHRGGGRYASREKLERPIPPEMQNLTDPALNGAIDIHFHVGPDSYPRSIDALDAAKLALSRGMRGAVLKHHFSQTAGLAYLARKAAPGFEASGVANRRSVEPVSVKPAAPASVASSTSMNWPSLHAGRSVAAVNGCAAPSSRTTVVFSWSWIVGW